MSRFPMGVLLPVLLLLLPVADAARAQLSKFTATQWSTATTNKTDLAVSSLPPGEGGCAVHGVDEYRPASKTTCYIRVYRCSNDPRARAVVNYNVGDIGWALTAKCRTYGKFLHIFHIEVARVWFEQSPTLGIGMLAHGGYEKCNEGACGCGLSGCCGYFHPHCGSEADEKGLTVNNFGWRPKPDITDTLSSSESWLTCPCHQYALPKRAMGPVDASKTKEFIDDQGWKHRKNTAAFQWNEIGAGRPVSFETCIMKHVIKSEQTPEEAVELFKKAVIDSTAYGCEPVGSREWLDAAWHIRHENSMSATDEIEEEDQYARVDTPDTSTNQTVSESTAPTSDHPDAAPLNVTNTSENSMSTTDEIEEEDQYARVDTPDTSTNQTVSEPTAPTSDHPDAAPLNATNTSAPKNASTKIRSLALRQWPGCAFLLVLLSAFPPALAS